MKAMARPRKWVDPRTRPAVIRAAAKRRAVRVAAGLVADEHEAIHGAFGLSYAHYLVVPRSLLQSMPNEWQQRFVDTLKEMDDFGLESPFGYSVQRRDDGGRFRADPFSPYRHTPMYTAADVKRLADC